jgi:uncharacterized membrane protein YhaH (DUF805 family)
MEWATLPLKRYAEFTGRSRRKEYWMFFLLNIVVSLVASAIDGVLGMSSMFYVYGPVTVLAFLALIVPGIAVSIRRLHDTGRSGWWVLLAFIPLIGGLVLLVFMLIEGQRGPNEYGADPKAEGAGVAERFA